MDVMFGVVECVVGAKGAMQQQIGVCSAAAGAPKTNGFEREQDREDQCQKRTEEEKQTEFCRGNVLFYTLYF